MHSINRELLSKVYVEELAAVILLMLGSMQKPNISPFPPLFWGEGQDGGLPL